MHTRRIVGIQSLFLGLSELLNRILDMQNAFCTQSGTNWGPIMLTPVIKNAFLFVNTQSEQQFIPGSIIARKPKYI